MKNTVYFYSTSYHTVKFILLLKKYFLFYKFLGAIPKVYIVE